MKRSTMFMMVIFIVLLCVLFTSCADVSPHTTDCITSSPSGFWSGLWHGFIATWAWFGSLFSDNIAIYDYDNSGAWYDFGFLLGVGGFSSGTTKVVSKKK